MTIIVELLLMLTEKQRQNIEMGARACGYMGISVPLFFYSSYHVKLESLPFLIPLDILR
jgi:hypothetical protein